MKNHLLLILTAFTILLSCNNKKPDERKYSKTNEQDSLIVSAASRAVMDRVKKGVELFNKEGENAFDTFRVSGSQWRSGDDYIFVFDTDGNMLVHTDTALEGKNVMDLVDVGGKPIIKGLLQTAKASVDGQGGWYHYQWPVPGGLFPRWKSSYVMPVTSASGSEYVIVCGIYTDRMEKEFVVDMVNAAVREINERG